MSPLRPTDELRQQIEDLALRLVVADPAATGVSEWMAEIEAIGACAAGANAGGVAVEAQKMLGALAECAASRTAASEVDGLTAALQEGILRLQQAMDTGSQPAAPPENAEFSLAEDPELLSDFILESREHLARIETQILTLEKDPRDSEALNSVFRGFHTMKGLAGFLELWVVQKMAHEVEAVLDRARNFELTITPKAIDVVLESADYLRRWLEHLEAVLQGRTSEPPRQDDALLGRIRSLIGGAQDAVPPAGDLVAMVSAVEKTGPPSEGAARIDTPAIAPVEEAEQPPCGVASRTGKPSEAMVLKVDTAKLDYLVDMAGEMVIAESLVRHDPELKSIKNQRLQRNLAQLMRITAELQKTAMAMRLVPIGPLFRRMARLVRDLARQFGKQVEMRTEGDEIELDRSIVEELADPLMHMVRNSLDHGIESPQERTQRGKGATAQLTLRAHHQGGQVVVEVADDGRGLDRAKILAKGIQRGLIESAEGLTDSEVYNLIFEPGFTTAATVTNVSGRGVGMDVVRRHIEKLRGGIEIHSQPGAGASFLLKLPLTLAIIDGLVVGVGQERFIVPLFAIREMFRPAGDTLWTVQQRGEMALVRNDLLPVFRLYQKFRMTPRSEDPRESVLIVAEAGGDRFCLMVDELIGKQEVVIKSLGETFKNVAGIAGGAILGDGRVGLILDLERLFKDRNIEAAR